MHNGRKGDYASEEVCVFNERDWKLDELGYVLCGLNDLCCMDVI